MKLWKWNFWPEEIPRWFGIDFWFLSKWNAFANRTSFTNHRSTTTHRHFWWYYCYTSTSERRWFSDAEIEKYGMDLSLKTIFEDFENHWEFSRGKENWYARCRISRRNELSVLDVSWEKHDITFQNTNAESPSEMHCKTLEKNSLHFSIQTFEIQKRNRTLLIHEQERQKQAENNRIAYVISADEIRESFPDYDPKHADDFQKDAFPLTEAAHQQALEKDTTGTIRWIAGGSGSGKSEVVLPELSVIPGIVIETTFSRYDFIRNEIEKALNAKKGRNTCRIHSLLNSVNHFCKQRSVRQVSDEQFIRTHWNFRKIYIKLPKSFTETKKVEIICYRNNVFVAENLLVLWWTIFLQLFKKLSHWRRSKKLSMSTIQMHQSAEKLHKQRIRTKKIKTGNWQRDFQNHQVWESQWTIPDYKIMYAKSITCHYTHKSPCSYSGPYSIGFFRRVLMVLSCNNAILNLMIMLQ